MSQCWNYDVFLSFRGKDVRKNFLGHLYKDLVQAGINTFKDEKELQMGEEISPELQRAIQESRISLIVFSRGYAHSRWCLNELLEIMECRKIRGQLVLPVFFKVDPSNVRNQGGSFAEAFVEHKRRHMINEMEKVSKWRSALFSAGNLRGWNLENDANGNESELIKKIVAEVTRVLHLAPLNFEGHPVGISSRVEDLTLLLNIGSDDVSMIGVYGMGGIGKTTIAKALYNRTFFEFEGCCFLENVSETAKEPNGFTSLQKTLLSEVTKVDPPIIASPSKGAMMIKQKLRKKKVLIIVDDVDDSKQLQSLVGNHGWFGSGSRIIITTRDVQLLDCNRVNEKYEMMQLDDGKSLELFSWHAFGEGTLSIEYEEVSRRIVRYSAGLPLALEVLGSSLRGASVKECESLAKKLKDGPDMEIYEKLKLSFDTLRDDREQAIFLDIACFFPGRYKLEDVCKKLEASGFNAEIGIRTLIKRCLLRIDESNFLRMHDLLRDMGREIVRKESLKEPERRSRLWKEEDAYEVLDKQLGMGTVEAIQLRYEPYDSNHSKLQVNTKAFVRMHRLRYLEISRVELNGSFDLLPRDIRWLSWEYCNRECLPLDFNLDSLVGLEMTCSSLIYAWHGKKVLNNLKFLYLNGSGSLIRTPDFTRLPFLEILSLACCPSLDEIDSSIGVLNRLISLDCSACHKLRELPSSICMVTSLEDLNLEGCRLIKDLPEDFGNMQALKILNVSRTSVEQFSFSFGGLEHLSESESLAMQLPPNLLELNLRDCRAIKKLNLSNATKLRKLDVEGCKGLAVIEGPKNLCGIEHIDIRQCSNLEIPSFLKSFLKGIPGKKNVNILVSTSKVPNWFNHQASGSSITFTVPLYRKHKFLGLILRADRNLYFSSHKISALIKDKTNNVQWAYSLGHLDQEESCLSFIPKKLVRSRMKGGESMEVFFEPAESILTCGIHLLYKDRGRHELVMEIVAEVRRVFDPVPLNVAALPVGIDSHVLELTWRLNIGSGDVRMIGIYGMGGMGKTTIAKALFIQFCPYFEVCCFLENVSEASKQPDGLVSLQIALLREANSRQSNGLVSLLDEVMEVDNLGIVSPFEGATLIKRLMQKKRVLIIVDDVGDPQQLQSLVGNHDWFGGGSRIVITTRDVHLLDFIRVNEKYEMKPLDDDESLELLRWHAFGEGTQTDEYKKVPSCIVEYPGELPFSLGSSSFCGANVSEWHNLANELLEYTDLSIFEKLKINFDTLKDKEVQDIFLDIACFFTGRYKQDVYRVLNACGFHAETGISTLIKSCLLSVDKGNRLQMHYLLRNIGREIVRKESPREPGRRSRLWKEEEAHEVLYRQLGMETIQAIQFWHHPAERHLQVSTKALARMNKLRLLMLKAVELSGSLYLLPRDIRWLSWWCCNLKCLPLDFHLDNLVGLDMRFSSLVYAWHGKKVLKNLKFLFLSFSESLVRTPDFTGSPLLETLDLSYCSSLEMIHPSIGVLKRLVHLDCSGCNKLRELPSSICLLTALEELALYECRSIKHLPEGFGNMQALRNLDAGRTAIKQLPFSFGCLRNLQTFKAIGCCTDRSLLISVSGLLSLTELELSNCGLRDDDIPSEIGSLSSLKLLHLSGNQFYHVPPILLQLAQLEQLHLGYCCSLQSFPPQLTTNLLELNLPNCKAIKELNLSGATKLRKLDIEGCEGLVVIDGLKNLHQIEHINVRRCHNLGFSHFGVSFFKEIFGENNVNIFLPTGKAPNWLSHQARGSSITFTVPMDGRRKFLGLILWASGNFHGTCLFSVLFRTNGFQWIHDMSYLSGVNSCLSFIPERLVRLKMEGGEAVKAFFEPAGSIWKCRIHPWYG